MRERQKGRGRDEKVKEEKRGRDHITEKGKEDERGGKREG